MKERIGVSGLFIGIGIWLGVIGQSLPQAQPAVLEKSETSSYMVQSKNEEKSLQLYALSAVLMDADSGRVLYGKESDVFRPMASTTKIMTCILALENGNLQDICTVSETAASQPKVHLGAGKGSEFYLNDLLYSLMLESHNDSAVIIAEQIGGSVEGFAGMMNQKARDIGCTDTNFVTPNGLDAAVTTAEGKEYVHGTTAEDLARIMRYCISDSPMKEEFLAITRTANHSFTDISGKRSYSCTNHNALLTMMPGALSGKTGFTNGAGYSYVGALEDQGRTYIIALLASGWPPNKTYKWADARTLFRFGMDEFHYRDVFEKLGAVSIPVEDGIPAAGEDNASVSLTLNLGESEQILNLLLRDSEAVTVRRNIPASVIAPVKKNQIIGSIDYYLNDEKVRSWPVFSEHAVEIKSLPYYWQKILRLFLV